VLFNTDPVVLFNTDPVVLFNTDPVVLFDRAQLCCLIETGCVV
jgi:hypothetical protein